MKKLLPILLLSVFISCKNDTAKPSEEKELTAQQLVDKAIAEACKNDCGKAVIEFTFRDKSYKSSRNNGSYKLERIQQDSVKGEIHDVVTNRGFYRFVNKEQKVLRDSIAKKVSDGVNSVHYFIQLPYGLNDPAVRKKIIGEATVKGEIYYELEVSFSEEGGGTDFEDRYVYWIHAKNFTVDYLAYSYKTNGGGIRFREAYNPREVNGIRFVDYNNLKPSTLTVPLENLDALFEKGELELVSKIETENIKVSYN